jgi:hypothetical protein
MNARLVCNGVDLDLAQGIPFPLNFSIADSKEPNKRKRNYSKSIVIEGTSNNMQFFSSTYQLSLTDLDNGGIGFNFDPTKRVDAQYFKGGIMVFNGLLQLNDVTIRGGNYFFSCTLFSNFIDLFMQLGDRKVSELGWDEYDHALTRVIVKKSWDTSVTLNGVDTVNFSGGNPLGFGYLYPLVDYGFNTIPSTFGINNLVPLVYIREIIEKCFAVAGLTITSNFIDSVLFRKLVFGYEGGKRRVLTQAQIDARHLEASGDVYRTNTYPRTNTSNGATNSFNYPNLLGLITGPTTPSVGLTTTISDIGTNIFLNNGDIQYIGLPGTYKMTVSGSYQQTITLNGGQTIVSGTHGFDIQFLRYGIVIDTVTVNAVSGALTCGVNYSKTFEYNTANNNNIFTSIRINSRINIQTTTQTPATITLVRETPIPFTYEIDCLDGTLNDGSIVKLAPVIPDMKAKDFMEGIIKAFNLYISDPNLFKEVTIEPLQSFYQPTTEFDDWSQIIDHDKDIKILPASTIDGKVYQFSFQDEDDYDNLRYKDEFRQRYGNLDYTIESTYQTGERKYELPFGQAVPIQLVNSSIVLPRIVKFENNLFVPFKGKPKVYFYNGLKTGNFRLTNVIASGGSEDLTSYPCVHHFDNFENPTFDWNWQLPSRIYYGDANTIVTTYNLFIAYHDKFIRELTGRDSKIVQAYAKLSAQMINTLDFSKLKMINGVLFRLNEIKDFDSDVAESTYIELLRIIEASNPIDLQGLAEATGTELLDVWSGGTDTIDEDTDVIFGGIGLGGNSLILRG